MKGAMIYVNAGKGHYIPAKALADSFVDSGNDAILVELFKGIFDAPFWEFFVRHEWRFMLRHPSLEISSSISIDTPNVADRIRRVALMKKYIIAFSRWYEENKPDFLLSTNFLGGALLPYVAKAISLNIPIYQYCPDVLDAPGGGITNLLTKVYISSEHGKRKLIEKGQNPSSISICPFPLRKQFVEYIQKDKIATRRAINISDKPTILFAFGGEGIGSIALLYELASRKIDCQAVLIGGSSRFMDKEIHHFVKSYPSFLIYKRGFVDNVEDYISACDIQVGKSGVNSIFEAIGLRRPFIMTEILYMSREYVNFLKEHRVGWAEPDVSKQANIIEEYLSNSKLREEINKEYNSFPIKISVDKFRDQIIADTKLFYEKRL